MKKYYLYFGFTFVSFLSLCILPIHSEESIVDVYINDVEIKEETILGKYVKEANIKIKTDEKEVFSTLEIQLLQDEKLVDTSNLIRKEGDSVSLKVPTGNHYTFIIQALVDGKKQIWNYDKHDFEVIEQPPIQLNKQPLQDYQVIQQTGMLYLPFQDWIQMDKSYMMIQNEKVLWKNVETGYSYEIKQPGRYQIEFHFFDENGIEFIQKNTVIKETEHMKTSLFVNEEKVEQPKQFYKEDMHLKIQTMVMEPSNLRLYINHEVQEITWDLKVEDYIGNIELSKEGEYFFQLFYKNETQEILLQETNLVLDKTAPIFHVQVDKQSYYQDQVMVDVISQDANFLLSSFIRDVQEEKVTDYTNWSQEDDGFHMRFLLTDEGMHQLQFHCQDAAGNQAIIYENNVLLSTNPTYTIDKTAPIIASNLDEITSSYHPQSKTVWFLMEDTHLKDDSLLIEVVRNQQPYPITFTKDKQTQQTRVEFLLEEDGLYEIQLTTADFANNTSKVIKHLQIDQTKPMVSVSTTHQQITNRDITLQIQGFDEAIQEYKLYVKRDQQMMREERYEENFKNVLSFHEDSGTHTYEVILCGKDKAGNENYATTSFILDKEAPLIQSFFQKQPYQARVVTNGPFDMMITWEDAYFEKAEILQYQNGELIDQRWLNDSFYKKRMSALAARKDDFQYIVRVYDKAGNMSDTWMDITLDTYLPPLEVVEEFQGNITNQSWIPLLKDIQKDIQIQDTTLFKNQKEITYVWGAPIEEEGEYQLLVTGKDQAGNIGLLKPFHFKIDKTPPTIQLLNKQAHQEITNAYEGEEFTLQINTGFLQKDKLTSILFNGKEMLKEQVFEYEMKVEAGEHQVLVTAIDEAGNQSEREVMLHMQAKQTSWKYHFIWFTSVIVVVVFSMKKIRCIS